MKISYYGKFGEFNTEKYIADALERAGHTVYRNEEGGEYVMYTKKPVKTDKLRIQWVFDLFRGYPGRSLDQLDADVIITTDGGDGFHTIRQGIDAPQKLKIDAERTRDLIFVGSPYYRERQEMIERTGAQLVQETRGMALNQLLAETKIVLGDSYPADRYWSNRVYEITGRGGFLIHPKTEGLPDYIPQFERGEEQEMIEYYIENEDERERLRQIQFENCPTYDDRVKELSCLLEETL